MRITAFSGNSNEAQQFLSRGAQVIVRMRGLPYDCRAEQVIDFFKRKQNENVPSVDVMDGEDGILFVNRADGRATGDAFVLFATEEIGADALQKHKEIIGTRYIELFRSTTAEVQQVINKSMEPQKSEAVSPTAPGLIGAMPTGPLAGLAGHLSPTMLPQQVIISGNRKDCIRLRGLPYEAQVQHILDFLGDFAKHIVFQGVHMVYNAQGHPSGEAFIQMDGEASAQATAAERHNKYMQIGKKQRYIEVFQCSADDMNLVLTGPANIPTPIIPASPVSVLSAQTRPILSPGTQLLQSPAVSFSFAPAGLTANGLPNSSQQNILSAQIVSALQQQGLANAAAASLAGYQNGTTQAVPTSSVAALQNLAFAGGAGNRLPFVPVSPSSAGLIPAAPLAAYYWPYPSPPVSPTNYYAQQAAAAALQQAAQVGPGVVFMRGIPFNTTVADVLTFFQGYELSQDYVQLLRKPDGRLTGDAYVTFLSRCDADRAVMEKNRHPINGCPVELFVYA